MNDQEQQLCVNASFLLPSKDFAILFCLFLFVCLFFVLILFVCLFAFFILTLLFFFTGGNLKQE